MTMQDGWFPRLKKLIESDERSNRALSRAIGRGPNYIQQMLKDEKEPGIDKVSKILEQFTASDAIYVIANVEVSQADLEFLKALSKVPDESRDSVLGILEALKKNEDAPLPAP